MVQLGYGTTEVDCSLPEADFTVLRTDARHESVLSDAAVGVLLDQPVGTPTLADIVSPGDSVLIVVSDATRATASAQIVNLLVRRLIASGASARDIKIIFATGIHRAVNAAEMNVLLTPFITQRIQTINHDAYDDTQLVEVGVNLEGAPVRVNRALKEHDHVILTGGISYHYFAGFTGGRKSVCPGLASAETISATHMLALDFQKGGRRTGVVAGALDGNAVHVECERVAELVQPAFLVNSIVDEKGRATALFTGHWRAAHEQACEAFAASHSIAIPERRAVVIVSCGGAPHDLNMIQAHKALDMAAYACVDGGDIIMLAECSDGLGRSDFLKWFEEADSSALEARLCSAYEVNGQTAWSLLTKTERFNVQLVSALPDAWVSKMRMKPAASLDQALARRAAKGPGYIMPYGAKLLPVLAV